MQFCSDSVLSVAWECFLGPFLAVSSHYLRPIPDSFLHTRIRMIAFYGFSISHYFSLPTNSAHCHQMSLKTFSGGICLVRLHPIQTVWHSNFCICDSYLPMFLAMTSQHKLFASSHFYCRVLTHLGLPYLLSNSLCPLPTITYWDHLSQAAFSDCFRLTWFLSQLLAYTISVISTLYEILLFILFSCLCYESLLPPHLDRVSFIIGMMS